MPRSLSIRPFRREVRSNPDQDDAKPSTGPHSCATETIDEVQEEPDKEGAQLSTEPRAYVVETIDADTINQRIEEERLRILREAEARRKAGVIRLTDLQLAVLIVFVENGGRAHSYGIFLEMIRAGQEWTEQAVRQAIDRLTVLGLIQPDTQGPGPSGRVERELVDIERANQIIAAEVKRRRDFLAEFRTSFGDRSPVG